MADNQIDRIINIETNADDANKQLTTTEQLLTDLVATNQELNKTIAEGSKKNSKAIEDSTKATKGLASGFKGIGLAFKAIGVGLILEAFNIIKDLFMQNSEVANVLAVATKALTLAFNDLVGFITKSIEPVKKFFTDIFENPQESLKEFGRLIQENLIERFTSLLEVFGHVGDGLKKLFSGDLDGAVKSFKSAGKEAVDVATGIDDSFNKGVAAVEKIGNAIADYTSNLIDNAKAQVNAENAAKIAAAQNAKLIEQYDRQAEKLRQLRDNEDLTIKERIKANNDLAVVLNKQEAAMRKNAALIVQAAQNNLNLNKSVENQVALIEAQTEAAGVLAQIEGFRSEQIVNRISLQKELNALDKTAADGEASRAIAQQKFNDEQEKDTLVRLENQKKSLEAERVLETQRLEGQRDLYKQGTQAYEDAQQELLNRQQEIDQQIITNNKATNDELVKQEFDKNGAIAASNTDELGRELLSFDARREALANQLALINEMEFASENERTAALKANTDARIALGDAEKAAKENQLNQINNLLMDASSLLGENTAAGKALAIASTTISTYMSAQAAYTGMVQAIPGPVGIALGAVAAGVSVASGLANVKKILSVKVPGGAGGAGATAGGAGATPSAPNFNVVGSSTTSQLSSTIAAQQQEPVRAYVVANDVTTQQSLDRNIITNATFG